MLSITFDKIDLISHSSEFFISCFIYSLHQHRIVFQCFLFSFVSDVFLFGTIKTNNAPLDTFVNGVCLCLYSTLFLFLFTSVSAFSNFACQIAIIFGPFKQITILLLSLLFAVNWTIRKHIRNTDQRPTMCVLFSHLFFVRVSFLVFLFNLANFPFFFGLLFHLHHHLFVISFLECLNGAKIKSHHQFMYLHNFQKRIPGPVNFHTLCGRTQEK